MMNSDPINSLSSQNVNLGSIDLQSLAQLVAHIYAIQNAATKLNLNPLMDLMSPYYFHLGESPGVPLIAKVLNHQNYHRWSKDMWFALKSKNKVCFINGSIHELDKDDPSFNAWDRCNTFIVSWIKLSLSQDIAQSVLWNRKELNLWNDLKRHFHQGDVFRIADLEEEMFLIR
ncbi:uncharacterized protein DS421_19g647380 [Arachis hypogaea]|uniref:Retrotransposon Copia-like N-terminal domain-containing protein n=1 Tax=Arachis hypogaea TaxID=3818 RepID=A0A6B9V691_ARAHY|nr:uncharacterized protein DS421_19g647380 [Arachis hypogaea]